MVESRIFSSSSFGSVVLGLDVGEQRELRQKFLHAAELKCELGELLDFVQPRCDNSHNSPSNNRRSPRQSRAAAFSPRFCGRFHLRVAQSSRRIAPTATRGFFGDDSFRDNKLCSARAIRVFEIGLSMFDSQFHLAKKFSTVCPRLCAPIPGSNCASRLKEISSRGFATNFK